MRNLKVIMSYRGTAYHGFQRQENAVAVQNIVEDTLCGLLRENVKINGCSRTDTGVHANEYCFSFLTERPIPCESLIRAVNCLLPPDIALISCEEADLSFHARFDCQAKEYVYLIDNSAVRNVFMSGMSLHYPYKLDAELMNEAAEHFAGAHDFTSFCGSADTSKKRVKTIEYCYIEKYENIVKILVKGDGFLYNMVRIIAGTLIYVNEGKIPVEDIPRIISAKDRTLAGKTAPPCGLYLNRVFY